MEYVLVERKMRDDSFFPASFESVLGLSQSCLLCMEYSILYQVELLELKARCLYYYAVHRGEGREGGIKKEKTKE